MEAAIQTIVKVYLKSSKGKESLGKKEFQGLVSGQLCNILSVRKSSWGKKKKKTSVKYRLHYVTNPSHQPVLTCRDFLSFHIL